MEEKKKIKLTLKTVIAIIIVIVLLLAGVVYFIIRNNTSKKENPVKTMEKISLKKNNDEKLLPFSQKKFDEKYTELYDIIKGSVEYANGITYSYKDETAAGSIDQAINYEFEYLDLQTKLNLIYNVIDADISQEITEEYMRETIKKYYGITETEEIPEDLYIITGKNTKLQIKKEEEYKPKYEYGIANAEIGLDGKKVDTSQYSLGLLDNAEENEDIIILIEKVIFIEPTSEGLKIYNDYNKTELLTVCESLKKFNIGKYYDEINTYEYVFKKNGENYILTQIIRNFNNNTKIFSLNGKLGLKNAETEATILEAKYDDISIDVDGIIKTIKDNEAKYGKINPETGELVLDVKYDGMSILSNGYISISKIDRIEKDNEYEYKYYLYGVADKKGNVIIDMKYEDVIKKEQGIKIENVEDYVAILFSRGNPYYRIPEFNTIDEADINWIGYVIRTYAQENYSWEKSLTNEEIGDISTDIFGKDFTEDFQENQCYALKYEKDKYDVYFFMEQDECYYNKYVIKNINQNGNNYEVFVLEYTIIFSEPDLAKGGIGKVWIVNSKDEKINEYSFDEEFVIYDGEKVVSEKEIEKYVLENEAKFQTKTLKIEYDSILNKYKIISCNNTEETKKFSSRR